MATAKKASPKKAASKKVATKKLINHVAFLLDDSASMSGISQAVKNQIVTLKEGIQKATPADQQVELSIFTFASANSFRTLVLNQPIETVDIKAAADRYSASGASTALVESTIKAIHTLAESGLKRSSDETYLLYVITDGQDNSSSYAAKTNIRNTLAELGDLWTVGLMVPCNSDRDTAVGFGFPAGNIEVWDAKSRQGVEVATTTINNSYADYSSARSRGVTNTSTLFRTNTADLKPADVRANLTEFNGSIHPVRKDSRIDEFVTDIIGHYPKGKAYYELSKPELVQGYKKLAVRSKTTDKTFAGDQARTLLGIGAHDMKIGPGDHGNWRIFIQSTSLNRKLLAGTSCLIEN